jgi:hypothetical protein
MIRFNIIVAFIMIGMFSLIHLVFVGHVYLVGITTFFQAAQHLAVVIVGS